LPVRDTAQFCFAAFRRPRGRDSLRQRTVPTARRTASQYGIFNDQFGHESTARHDDSHRGSPNSRFNFCFAALEILIFYNDLAATIPAEQGFNRELLFAEQRFFPSETGIGCSLNREWNSRNRWFSPPRKNKTRPLHAERRARDAVMTKYIARLIKRVQQNLPYTERFAFFSGIPQDFPPTTFRRRVLELP
jgi:hypothetical protein